MTKIRTAKLKPGEIIPLNFDFMFTSIFNKKENIDILENFLSYYLEIPMHEIKGKLKLLNRRLELKNKHDKNKEIDLLLDYKGRKINIELSNGYKPLGVKERNVVFVCGIHSKQLKYNDKNYSNICETIQINLNNFECNEHDVIETYYLTNKYGDIFSEKLRIDIVDIVKGTEKWYPNINNKLIRWCKALVSTTEEELKEALGEDLMEKETKERLINEVNDLSSDDDYVILYTELSKEELERNTYELEKSQYELEKSQYELEKSQYELEKSKYELEKSQYELEKKEFVKEMDKVKNQLMNEKEKLDSEKEKLDSEKEKLNNEKNFIAKALLKNKVSIDIISTSTGLTKEEIENLKF